MSEPASASLAATAPEREPNPPVRRGWNLATRIFFRFTCVYWLLYSLPSNGRVSFLGILPGAQAYKSLWRAIVPWVAIHLFHVSGSVTVYRLTGSGDTTLDYVQQACFLVVAAVAAIVWSLLDRG